MAAKAALGHYSKNVGEQPYLEGKLIGKGVNNVTFS
jgi:hypothetical protein